MSIDFTGERVVPGQVDPDLWNEHIARYVYASSFCTGARVLDAGTGAGYGCATLADNARSVVGLDIAHDAVRFASAEYDRPNASWLQASLVALPFTGDAFDVVVAFEVIEHLADWRQFLQEARRVLRDGGVFLVSTPNKSFYAESREQSGPNPFHEYEFEYAEFRDALCEVFPYVHIVLENHSQCIVFDAGGGQDSDARMVEPGSVQDANFYLAVCSSASVEASSFVYVPRAANVLKERGDHIRRLEQELSTKNDWLAKAQSEHAELVAVHERQTHELRASNTWAEELNVKLKASADRVVALQGELDDQQQVALRTAREYQQHLDEAHRDLAARTEWARDLEMQAAECREQLARCVALLDDAEATVVERTNWAQDLERQLVAAQSLLAGIRASRWVKLGRIIQVGPELPS